ncbi:hypothetical protein D1AOALGA4SA_10304 [Olavius algarvensis Delta 1 endosymbiont]|nr:hypothetical protein D1AOALGA4SA_10304 [Olavius algarvensis Delta 1 endosymbiont]
MSSLIAKDTLIKRITNIEQGIMNIEVRHSIIIILEKRLSAAIPPFDILRFDIRYSAVRFFCSLTQGSVAFSIPTPEP